MRSSLAHSITCLLLSCLTLSTPPVLAEDSAGSIEIELNRLESQANACRPYLVFGNKTDTRFESLGLELVLFDQDGFILKRFGLEAGPLAPGKTSVKLFEIADLSCDALGRILLNAVTACTDASGPVDGCLARMRTSSRLPVDFFK
ncbi:hypothetical protein [Imhoffiella purpurea]|uniref:Tat pathway signal sequence domain protein n=1 Tax=Imhoffiella purpurea TaxID=1249627 RepID=W9VB71_9GAMM|nr:hypothetical protein [Imhoffiella purpurea]EXJ14206.1 hypothetical protein D779_2877 [Imhoffiella purpurea]